MKFAIIGAGFSGAVRANELAKSGHDIHVFESRSHVGGNCYSERDASTGIMVHKYGPHIFHTDNLSILTFPYIGILLMALGFYTLFCVIIRTSKLLELKTKNGVQIC